MKFTIRGKEEDVRFGMRFIRTLDETYKVDYQGLKFGMGVNLAQMGLNQYNPTTLADVIEAGLSHERNAPRIQDIEMAVEDFADENDGLGELFELVLSEMGKSTVVKDSITKFDNMAQIEQEQQND